MKYISGATGYTILKKDEKVIILFGDIHDSVNYCKQGNESIDIDKYLDKKSDNYQVLLEESTNDPELNLSDLWSQSYHTNNLKNLKINNPNVIPIDIRPYLIPFSWQLVESNNKYKKLIFKKYIFKFDEFLNKRGNVYLRFITPYFEYIINDEYKNKLEKVFSTIKKIQPRGKLSFAADKRESAAANITLRELRVASEAFIHVREKNYFLSAWICTLRKTFTFPLICNF